MEKVKHGWRNAACLLFVTGPFRYSPKKAGAMRALLETHTKGKRPPTTSFLQLDTERGREDMEMMFVQRHSKSGFMADMHVFPGGVLDEADYSPQWLSVFSHLEASFPALHSNSQLPLYSQIPAESSPITGELAFRICAIREMFEEAGVLLVRDKTDSLPLSGMLPGTFSPSVRELSDREREHWRRRVHNNAQDFLTLCSELNCVPDVWSLMEWSNWLTPWNHKRRFDTVFYMVFSESKPALHHDGVEATSSTWMSPSVALKRCSEGEVLLAPPQFAEIMKLRLFSDSPCLHSYAMYNSLCESGVERILSVRIVSKDGVMVSVNHHDDLYPESGSENWEVKVQRPQAPHLQGRVELVLSDRTSCEYTCPTHTAGELLQLSEKLSRLEVYNMTDCRSHDNSSNTSELAEHLKRYNSLYGAHL